VSAPGAAGRIGVFLNASAGAPMEAAALRARLGAELVDVTAVPAAALRAAVRRAVDEGATIVGVAGGDGTLQSAAAVLAGTRTVLAPVPTGTLNHFARRVGITSVEDAAVALRTRRSETLPVGMAGEHLFLNTLTFGEYARIVRMRESSRRVLGKWPAAALAFLVAGFSVRRLRLSLTVGDTTLARLTPFVWVGVGWGSFPRVHEALERRRSPDLEVAVLSSPTRRARLGFLLRISARMAGRQQPVRDRALEILHLRRLVVDSRRRIDATADGEVLRLQPPVEVGVRDAALRVLTGPGVWPAE
jgi:diacylglycerol kinase family enzyme